LIENFQYVKPICRLKSLLFIIFKKKRRIPSSANAIIIETIKYVYNERGIDQRITIKRSANRACQRPLA